MNSNGPLCFLPSLLFRLFRPSMRWTSVATVGKELNESLFSGEERKVRKVGREEFDQCWMGLRERGNARSTVWIPASGRE